MRASYFGAGDVDVVLGLGLGGLERAGKQADFSILDLLNHLRMADFLVDENSLDQSCVLDAAAGLGLDFD